MCSNTLLYVTSYWHNESNRIFFAFASIRSKFTIFDSLQSIYMKLRYETNFLRESSNLSSPRFPSPRFVNICEPCLSTNQHAKREDYDSILWTCPAQSSSCSVSSRLEISTLETRDYIWQSDCPFCWQRP